MKNKKKILRFKDVGSKIKTVYIPELEGSLRYGCLNIAEVNDIVKQHKTDIDRGFAVIAQMLAKADKEFTFETVKELPANVFFWIVMALSKAEGLPNGIKKLTEKTNFYQM